MPPRSRRYRVRILETAPHREYTLECGTAGRNLLLHGTVGEFRYSEIVGAALRMVANPELE